jgi:hypothetical protein
MAVSYPEIVGSIANPAMIDEELFIENSGEQWMVGERMKIAAPGFRERFKDSRGGMPPPLAFQLLPPCRVSSDITARYSPSECKPSTAPRKAAFTAGSFE